MSPIKPIRSVQDPPTVGRSAGIGRASQNVLVKFVVETFNRIKEGLSDLLRHAADSILETWERPLVTYVSPIIEDILKVDGIPESIRAMLQRARSGQDQVGVIALGMVLFVAANYLAGAAFSGLQEKVRQGSYNLFNPNLLDFGTWHQAVLRDPAYAAQMMQELAWQGWTERQVAAARLVAEQRLGINEIVLANYRGEISDSEAVRRMEQLGVPSGDAAILFRLGEQIPGPADLVRFALREVWNEGVVSEYGYDQGASPEFAAWMEKQGYNQEWARAFWRAHWMVPSVGQMIEMFHRQEISYEQLTKGLQVNDLAPGWIDPLLGITYSLLTRVDVKRALRYGEYSIDEVFSEYRKLGYDERRARILTNIAIKESVDEVAGLTRAAVLKAYTKGRLDRDEARASLEDLGIVGDVADFYLDQAELDRQDELLDRRVANVEKRFKAGLISENQALEELTGLGVGGEEARLDVGDWALSKRTTVKAPTRANLDEFFLQGIIDTGTYDREMLGLGYDPVHVGWYLGSLSVDAAKQAAAEEERAQKERQRILEDRRSTDYERGKAEIDRDIAELSAAIADSQVALVEARNEKEQATAKMLSARDTAALRAEYDPLFREVDAAVASARLSISQIQTQISARTSQINEHKRSIAAGRDVVLDTKLRNERAARQTEIALLDQQIAERKTDIARLTEAIPLAESAEQQADLKQTILELKTEQAELEEQQAGERVRIREIDEQLPVELTAERRAELEAEIRTLQAEIDDLRLQIDDLEEGIYQTQAERLAIESEYRAKVEAVPGRRQQIETEARYDAMIDAIEARIAELRANVADRRLAKAQLAVGWRS